MASLAPPVTATVLPPVSCNETKRGVLLALFKYCTWKLKIIIKGVLGEARVE